MLKTISNGMDPYIGKIVQELSFVHAEDVALAAVQSLTIKNALGIYHITDGNSYNRYEFSDISKSISSSNPIFSFIFYFLLIRPQQKKAKEHQAMLSSLSVGDEVVTVGGILGKVSAIGEGVVTLEVAKDVQIKVQKFQVSSLVPKGTLKG